MFFSLAGRSVADIVGVDVPKASGVEPRLDLSPHPQIPIVTGPASILRPHAGGGTLTLDKAAPLPLGHVRSDRSQRH